jgi:hypothetical protein
MGASSIVGGAVVGLGATLFMDVWALLLKSAFNVPLPNYCLVGRWVGHMPKGIFVHANIADSAQKHSECMAGWIVHYVVGAMYALVFVALAPANWLAHPTLLPALVFGMVSVLVAYLVMQPSFGLGIAASRAPRPMLARLRSLMAHTVFGVGLYVSAVCLNHVL